MDDGNFSLSFDGKRCSFEPVRGLRKTKSNSQSGEVLTLEGVRPQFETEVRHRYLERQRPVGEFQVHFEIPEGVAKLDTQTYALAPHQRAHIHYVAHEQNLGSMLTTRPEYWR